MGDSADFARDKRKGRGAPRHSAPAPKRKPKPVLRRSGPTSSRPSTTRPPVSAKKPTGLAGFAARRKTARPPRPRVSLATKIARGTGEAIRSGVPTAVSVANVIGGKSNRQHQRRTMDWAREASGLNSVARIARHRGRVNPWEYLAVAGAVPGAGAPVRAVRGMRALSKPSRQAANMFEELKHFAASRSGKMPAGGKMIAAMDQIGRAGGVRGVKYYDASARPDWLDPLSAGANIENFRQPFVISTKGQIAFGPRGSHHHHLGLPDTPEWNYTPSLQNGPAAYQGALWYKPGEEFANDVYLQGLQNMVETGGWGGVQPTRRQLAALNRWMFQGKKAAGQ